MSLGVLFLFVDIMLILALWLTKRRVRMPSDKRLIAKHLKIRGAAMKSPLHEQSHRSSECRPISLLAYLQTENRRLQNLLTQLEQDTKALREILQNS